MTPGVDGIGNMASSPLSFPDDIFSSLVTFEMLSRREDGRLNSESFGGKYPVSPVLLPPGDVGTGL
jgi:hypothetical protein